MAMELWQQLELRPGIVCITGSGGKTTLAEHLTGTLPGRVIFCTTTHIFPPAEIPVLIDATEEQLCAALERGNRLCVGTPAEDGKLTAPGLDLETLRELADYVVVESDGAHRRPMKAHEAHEPVLPAHFDRNLLLVGAQGFGQPIVQAAHRPERFAALADLPMDAPITPESVAAVLRQEGGFDTVIVNQVTDGSMLQAAQRLAVLLDVPVYAGEIQKGLLEKLT